MNLVFSREAFASEIAFSLEGEQVYGWTADCLVCGSQNTGAFVPDPKKSGVNMMVFETQDWGDLQCCEHLEPTKCSSLSNFEHDCSFTFSFEWGSGENFLENPKKFSHGNAAADDNEQASDYSKLSREELVAEIFRLGALLEYNETQMTALVAHNQVDAHKRANDKAEISQLKAELSKVPSSDWW